MVSVVIEALCAVTLKLGDWLQQIPGTTFKISVQNNAVKHYSNSKDTAQ